MKPTVRTDDDLGERNNKKKSFRTQAEPVTVDALFDLSSLMP